MQKFRDIDRQGVVGRKWAAVSLCVSYVLFLSFIFVELFFRFLIREKSSDLYWGHGGGGSAQKGHGCFFKLKIKKSHMSLKKVDYRIS